MALDKFMTVEVAYATPHIQKIITVQVKKNSTIEDAIQRSGILDFFPEIDLLKQKVGIFSQLKKLTDPVEEGERIEIYRSLITDPKIARREKAKKASL